ncbi:MAG TPA: Uma2 family endonuclease [Gemmatirosa sp.]
MSRPERLCTEAEYLALEDNATEKSEYVNGRMYAMSGASPNHDRIVFNATRELANQLRGRPCRGLTADMRVKATVTGAYFYPDLGALCGTPEYTNSAGVQMLVNPSVIIEVLSESTAAFDRGEKFEHYRRIPSLREYAVIAQDRTFVELRVLRGDVWMLAAYSTPDDGVALASVGCTLRLRDLYENVEFPADGARTAPRLLREDAPPAYA